MIRIDPNAIYSCAELEEQLRGIVGLDTFLKKLGVPRRFNGAVLGADIIRAMQKPPDCPVSIHSEPNVGFLPKRGRGRPRRAQNSSNTCIGMPSNPIRVEDVVDAGRKR